MTKAELVEQLQRFPNDTPIRVGTLLKDDLEIVNISGIDGPEDTDGICVLIYGKV